MATWKTIGRKALSFFNRHPVRLTMGHFDRFYLAPDVPQSDFDWLKFTIDNGNQSGKRILEIGSREVTGPSLMRDKFPKAQYVGFDYLPGHNVDVVGDAHHLSGYFSAPFDIIYASAVFEHLAMPWVVAEEIAKLLNPGGIVTVATHFSYSSHERPWHFFQFSDMGLRTLFNADLGFECINAGMREPMIGRFSALASKPLRYQPITGLYCSSYYVGRRAAAREDFNWRNVSSADVTGGKLLICT
jgi:SAM-dependent methyltransferase